MLAARLFMGFTKLSERRRALFWATACMPVGPMGMAPVIKLIARLLP